MKHWATTIIAGLALLGSQTVCANGGEGPATSLEEVVVWGEKKSSQQAGYTNPISLLTPEDLVSINVATTEDVVKYEPSLVVRRRFIGDANGTLGIRGSNMFQTSRSMVFADGVPLHYLLQSRWSGAPRWNMVSASEIAEVEVIYGPFSAQYSGNAMGGVVVIETAIPQQRKFHFDTSLFSQTFDDYGFDDTVTGYKSFLSYGDKLGDLSIYLSYNRLQNESQPQSFHSQSFHYGGGNTSTANPLSVTGALPGNDAEGAARLYFGDTGAIDTTADNFKLKAGYEFGDWFVLLNVAYEAHLSQSDSANTYLRDASGNPVWGGNATQSGQAFSVPASRLNVSELERQSLSLGLRLKGDLTENLAVEANVNRFDVLRDENRASARNPDHPDDSLSGEVTDYGDTGWESAEVKLTFNDLGLEGLSLITGMRYEAYALNIDVYDSSNYLAGSKDAFAARSGGETTVNALFAQMNWNISQRWDLALGGRYESWKSRGGYYSEDDPGTSVFDLRKVPGRSGDEFSPKLSLGYQPANQWMLRYSLAKAYRFPIVEELFSQYQVFNAINEANPELKPEKGLHHNLMVERSLASGYLRVSLFQENIKDVIEAQSTVLPGGISVRTFIPIDEVETWGVEFVANIVDARPNLDLRFNAAWTDATIRENNANPLLEGKVYPRMPEWRANLLATYHLSEDWTLGANLQYAADSYGNLDNSDKENNVDGAQDGYLRLGFKSNYQINDQLGLSVGIDNVTNEKDYVAHPWPGRSYYLSMSYDFL